MKKLRKLPENRQLGSLIELMGNCGACGPCGCAVGYVPCGGKNGSYMNDMINNRTYYEVNYRNNYGS